MRKSVQRFGDRQSGLCRVNSTPLGGTDSLGSAGEASLRAGCGTNVRVARDLSGILLPPEKAVDRIHEVLRIGNALGPSPESIGGAVNAAALAPTTSPDDVLFFCGSRMTCGEISSIGARSTFWSE